MRVTRTSDLISLQTRDDSAAAVAIAGCSRSGRDQPGGRCARRRRHRSARSHRCWRRSRRRRRRPGGIAATQLRLPGQRQFVDQPHHLVELDAEAGGIGHGDRPDAVDVARHRPAHAFEARLVVARQPLVGLPQGDDQRFGAAGEHGLLQRHAQRRLDVEQQVLVARARQRLDQRLDLRPLHRDFGNTCLEQRHLGGRSAGAFLGLPRQRPCLRGLRLGFLLPPHELLFERAQAVLRLPGQHQRDPAQQADQQQHQQRMAQPPAGAGRRSRCRRRTTATPARRGAVRSAAARRGRT